MMVSIEFFGTQRVVTKTYSVEMPISGKTRVNDALEFVRHHFPDLNLDNGAILMTVNHEIASPDRILIANDIVSFLPPIGGG